MDIIASSLIDLLKNSMNISCCYFDRAFNYLSSNSESSLTSIILTNSECFPAIQKHTSESNAPAIAGTELGILWLSVYAPKDDQYLVFGPVFSTEISTKTTEAHLIQYKLSISAKHKLTEYMRDLPVINYNVLIQYAKMIFFALSGAKITDADIVTLESLDDGKNEGMTDKPAATRDRMKTWLFEQQLMKHIEEGDLEYKPALVNARTVSYGVKMNVGDPLRQMKTSTITFISLAVRAAIRGGLTPEMAYYTGDIYIEKAEKCTSFAELTNIANEMYIDFISKVNSSRHDPRYSTEIQSCCDYITLHLEEKISLADIAERIGYSEYYLSRKFRKETGMSINDFINRKKIWRAEILLSTTDLSIKQIAEKLFFSSETYFSTVFAKINGVSPTKYRFNKMNVQTTAK